MPNRIIAFFSSLIQTANGNVEARVACFYRRRDISAYLVNQVDRLKIDGEDETKRKNVKYRRCSSFL